MHRSILSNPERNKPLTVLIRILTNYFQLLMIVKNFDLSWPSAIQDALSTFSFIMSSLDLIISFDCLYLMSGVSSPSIQNSTFSTFYLKVITFGIAPIAMSLCAAIFWTARYLFRKRRNKVTFDLRLTIQVTTFIIIYLLYPIIVNLTLSLFYCTQIEDPVTGKSFYLIRDLSV